MNRSENIKKDTSITREMIKKTSKSPQSYEVELDEFVKSIPQEEIKKNHLILSTKVKVDIK